MSQKKRRVDGDTGYGSKEAFQRWAERMMREHGKLGTDIVKSLIEDCGGLRICLPDMQDLYRQERDRAIRNRFVVLAREVGSSQAYAQLALNCNLSIWQVRRIVNEEKEHTQA